LDNVEIPLFELDDEFKGEGNKRKRKKGNRNSLYLEVGDHTKHMSFRLACI